MMSEVRVRFAPSPTGALHIGGVRTALYNYLFAKKHNGTFVLRIEDTDQTRYVPGAEDYIFNSLKWLNIEPDESLRHGGEYGPYRQSDRKDLYKKYVDQLIESGHAYYAFDTPEELEAMRERLKAARVKSPQYNSITRETMKNSLTLPADEVKQRLESGEPYVVRIKIPRKEEVRLHDAVRGWVMVHSSAIDDKVIMKGDGMPTYHLANVVDDHLMKISHVIRGEEWLPSAPLHVLLYRFLGWEETMPEFAHLPLILKPDGNGKLSKRDAKKHGFPIFPLAWEMEGQELEGFRESGYLPDALNNFLAFLGWNPGTHQEIFHMDELVEAFTIERIGKSGTKFDIDKAKWYNQQYIKEKPDTELGKMLLDAYDKELDADMATRIGGLLKDRITFPYELAEQAKYILETPESYDEKVIRKKWSEEVQEGLRIYSEYLIKDNPKTADDFSRLLQQSADDINAGVGKLMQPLRAAITGHGAGPDLKEIMVILGSEEIARRISRAIERIQIPS